MSMRVVFSPGLLREHHIISLRTYLRILAVIVTLGEVFIGYLCFKRSDFLGAYAMGAYLSKEHVIQRILGKDP